MSRLKRVKRLHIKTRLQNFNFGIINVKREMNEPLYKTFLTAKLSPRSNSKIARQYFFYFSFCSIEKMKYVVVQKKNVIKNYMEFKDTRIWFKQRSMLRLKHDLLWTKIIFLEIWYRHWASNFFVYVKVFEHDRDEK